MSQELMVSSLMAAYVSPVVDGTLPFRAVQAVLYVVDDAGDTAFVIASVSTTAFCWLGKLVDCQTIGVAPSLRLQMIFQVSANKKVRHSVSVERSDYGRRCDFDEVTNQGPRTATTTHRRLPSNLAGAVTHFVIGGSGCPSRVRPSRRRIRFVARWRRDLVNIIWLHVHPLASSAASGRVDQEWSART